LTVLGRHNSRPLRPHARRTAYWRKTLRSAPHARHHRPPTPRVANPEPHRQRGCSLRARPTPRPRVPLRADGVLAPDAAPCADDGDWVYRGRGQQRGRGGAVHDRDFGAGSGDVGVASGLCGVVWGHGSVLGWVAEDAEEEGVRTGASRKDDVGGSREGEETRNARSRLLAWISHVAHYAQSDAVVCRACSDQFMCRQLVLERKPGRPTSSCPSGHGGSANAAHDPPPRSHACPRPILVIDHRPSPKACISPFRPA